MSEDHRLSRPSDRDGAELIIKSNVECSSRFPGWVAPGLFLLGNKEGFLWLSEYLAWFASQVSEEHAFNDFDPDNHQHIDYVNAVNEQLSDNMGFMVGAFSSRHRSRVLEACTATPAQQKSGGPIQQLADYLDLIEKCCNSNDEIASQVASELTTLVERSSMLLNRLRREHGRRNR